MKNWHQNSERDNKFYSKKQSNNRFHTHRDSVEKGNYNHSFDKRENNGNNKNNYKEEDRDYNFNRNKNFRSNNYKPNTLRQRQNNYDYKSGKDSNDNEQHFKVHRAFSNKSFEKSSENKFEKQKKTNYNFHDTKERHTHNFHREFNTRNRFDNHYNKTNNDDEISFHPKKHFRENNQTDSRYSNKKQQEFIKSNVDPSKPMRLNRYLANAGICSRREADDYIQAGVVSVNNKIVTELGTKIIPATDKILFHNQAVKSERKIYILLNKPKDCVTTTDDPEARITVMDIVKNACSERIYPVGRLDRNTTGLLLLTNDGDLSAKLMHPKYNNKKIYEATLDHSLSDADMQSIADGFELSDGKIHADEICFPDQKDKKIVGIEIHSGRNRIVRRMFEHFGYKVLKLDRVLFAGLTKKNLPRGQWRYLTAQEVIQLQMGR